MRWPRSLHARALPRGTTLLILMLMHGLKPSSVSRKDLPLQCHMRAAVRVTPPRSACLLLVGRTVCFFVFHRGGMEVGSPD
jgi:hypothetical protein